VSPVNKNVLLKIIAEFGAGILAFLHFHAGDVQNNGNIVQDTHFFISADLGQHLLVIQHVFFLE
jgi:hypothetical protein